MQNVKQFYRRFTNPVRIQSERIHHNIRCHYVRFVVDGGNYKKIFFKELVPLCFAFSVMNQESELPASSYTYISRYIKKWSENLNNAHVLSFCSCLRDLCTVQTLDEVINPKISNEMGIQFGVFNHL